MGCYDIEPSGSHKSRWVSSPRERLSPSVLKKDCAEWRFLQFFSHVLNVGRIRILETLREWPLGCDAFSQGNGCNDLEENPTAGAVGRTGFDFQQGQEIFVFSTASRTALNPTQPPTWLSPGIKRLGREADHFHHVPRPKMMKLHFRFHIHLMAWCLIT
jgi:hypothetical protein